MLDAASAPALWPAWPAVALVFGLVVGSFANVCIHRLPRGESVVHPRSRCPRCGAPIGAGDNVPVLSYLALGGRCRNCRARIGWRYPAVEAAHGALFLGVALAHGPSVQALVQMFLVSALLILSIIDLEHQILPNVITRPGIAVGLLASLLPGAPTWLESALAALAGYGVFAAVAWTYRKSRGIEGLGQGDWKLAAMLGAFLGWQGMLLVVLIASVAGTVVGLLLMRWGGRSAQHRLPFGTFLGLAGIVVVFVGEPLLLWYRGFLTP